MPPYRRHGCTRWVAIAVPTSATTACSLCTIAAEVVELRRGVEMVVVVAANAAQGADIGAECCKDRTCEAE